jgi:hypothetical protein
MRLLSELFPKFVKKSQIVRLDEGPFGAGVMKARMYLKPGEEPPQGAKVQTGPKGGRYYEDTGGSGGGGEPQPYDRGQAAAWGSIDNETPGWGDQLRQEEKQVEQFYSNVSAKQGELGRRVTPEEYKEIWEEVQAGAQQGPSVDEHGFDTEGPQPSLEERQARAQGQLDPAKGDVAGFYSAVAAKQGELGRRLTPQEQSSLQSQYEAGPSGLTDEHGFDTGGPQPSLEERQARATQGPPQEKGEVEQFYSNVAAKQGELGRRLTPEEQQQVLADTQAGSASQAGQGQPAKGEVEQFYSNISALQGKLGRRVTPEEQQQVLADTKAGAQQGPSSESQAVWGQGSDWDGGTPQPDTMAPRQVERLRNSGELSDPTFDGPRDERGYLKSRSASEGPAFDDQGNVHVGTLDPMPLAELLEEGGWGISEDGELEAGGFVDSYQTETGKRLSPNTVELLANYSPNLGGRASRISGGPSPDINSIGDGFDDYLRDVAESDGSSLTAYQDSETGAYPDAERYYESMETEIDESQEFFAWITGKAAETPSYLSGGGTETMKMVKMMQTHNINNTRRDPIVLANRGGNQRRNSYVRGIYKK